MHSALEGWWSRSELQASVNVRVSLRRRGLWGATEMVTVLSLEKRESGEHVEMRGRGECVGCECTRKRKGRVWTEEDKRAYCAVCKVVHADSCIMERVVCDCVDG